MKWKLFLLLLSFFFVLQTEFVNAEEYNRSCSQASSAELNRIDISTRPSSWYGVFSPFFLIEHESALTTMELEINGDLTKFERDLRYSFIWSCLDGTGNPIPEYKRVYHSRRFKNFIVNGNITRLIAHEEMWVPYQSAECRIGIDRLYIESKDGCEGSNCFCPIERLSYDIRTDVGQRVYPIEIFIAFVTLILTATGSMYKPLVDLFGWIIKRCEKVRKYGRT